MSKAQDALRERQIFNDYEFSKLGGTPLYVEYRPYDNSRGGHTNAWRVQRSDGLQYKGPWYCYGAKEFYGLRDSPERDAAFAFAAKETGLTRWARSPYGGWHPVEAFEKVGVKVPKNVIEVAEAMGKGRGT